MVVHAPAFLEVLRAVGEATRLRLVTLLAEGELTVTDLTDILGQSQPRISRHLKLLSDAGVVDRHREGAWVYFSLVADGPVRSMVDGVLGHLDPGDPAVVADRDRLGLVRARRVDAAQRYFAGIAGQWDQVRSLHASEERVEAEVMAALDQRPYRTVLDIGTGTGRMLQLLIEHARSTGPPVERAVGLDANHSMLAVARANFDRSGLRGVELRQGDAYAPPFEPASFDLVVVHQVLHFLDDPARAVREAARMLAPGGRLLVVDFAPHDLSFLQTDHQHRRLGFRDEAVIAWMAAEGLAVTDTGQIDPINATDQSLTVSLWLAESGSVADRPPTTPVPSGVPA